MISTSREHRAWLVAAITLGALAIPRRPAGKGVLGSVPQPQASPSR